MFGLCDPAGYALVLVVDLGWRIERLLQPAGAEQRRRPPLPVDLLDLLGDLDTPARCSCGRSAPWGTAARDRPGRPAGRCAGCSGGGRCGGSATRLYHCVGIDASSSRILVCRPTRWPRVQPRGASLPARPKRRGPASQVDVRRSRSGSRVTRCRTGGHFLRQKPQTSESIVITVLLTLLRRRRPPGAVPRSRYRGQPHAGLRRQPGRTLGWR